jgi:hypothetical protein
MPPMGEAAAFATFVFGPVGALNKLVGPGPFAPKVGTALEENPAVNGFVLDGADIEVPDAGRSGFAPVFEAVGLVEIFVPTGFDGT